jgi:hypothetical protein
LSILILNIAASYFKIKKLKTNINRTFRFNAYAFFLAFLVFTAFGGKELHILLEHSHAAVEICDAKTGDVHLHDYDNLEHGCDLCDFTFSYFEQQFTSFYLHSAPFLIFKKEFSFISFKLSCAYLFQSLRAPPVLNLF